MASPRIVQLRNAFGLDDSEELYGQFSCAHTRPRWGSQFLQGQLYVFSSVVVFHANLLAVIRVERIHFKDVQIIRKRSFLRMPNTIAVESCDRAGIRRDDVFTSFLFVSRKKAFNVMVARWRAVNPEAAESYFISLAGNSSSSLRDVGSLTSSTYTSGELDSPLAAGSSVTGRFSQRALAAPNGSGSAAAGALGPDHFPAWREVSGPSASALLAVPGDMTVMAAVELPGITARTLAEVLLSDLSGFLPSLYKAQGNEVVSLTPWQVSSGRHPCSCAPHLQQPTGSLTRTLQYIYSNNGPWGAVRSLVVQEQMLLVGPGGRLVLIITQRMPDLPTGVGKCFYLTLRWDITPTAAPAAAAPAHGTAVRKAQPDDAAVDGAEPERAVSPRTPNTPAAAAAAGDAAVLSAGPMQQQLAASPFGLAAATEAGAGPSALKVDVGSTPTAAAAAADSKVSDSSFSSDSSCSSPSPRVVSQPGIATVPHSSSADISSSCEGSSPLSHRLLDVLQQGFSSSGRPANMAVTFQEQYSNSSPRGVSPSKQRLNFSASNGPVADKLPGQQINDMMTGIRSSFKHSFKATKQATKQGFKELKRSAKSVSNSVSGSPLTGFGLTTRKSLDKTAGAAAAAAASQLADTTASVEHSAKSGSRAVTVQAGDGGGDAAARSGYAWLNGTAPTAAASGEEHPAAVPTGTDDASPSLQASSSNQGSPQRALPSTASFTSPSSLAAAGGPQGLQVMAHSPTRLEQQQQQQQQSSPFAARSPKAVMVALHQGFDGAAVEPNEQLAVHAHRDGTAALLDPQRPQQQQHQQQPTAGNPDDVQAVGAAVQQQQQLLDRLHSITREDSLASGAGAAPPAAPAAEPTSTSQLAELATTAAAAAAAGADDGTATPYASEAGRQAARQAAAAGGATSAPYRQTRPGAGGASTGSSGPPPAAVAAADVAPCVSSVSIQDYGWLSEQQPAQSQQAAAADAAFERNIPAAILPAEEQVGSQHPLPAAGVLQPTAPKAATAGAAPAASAGSSSGRPLAEGVEAAGSPAATTPSLTAIPEAASPRVTAAAAGPNNAASQGSSSSSSSSQASPAAEKSSRAAALAAAVGSTSAAAQQQGEPDAGADPGKRLHSTASSPPKAGQPSASAAPSGTAAGPPVTGADASCSVCGCLQWQVRASVTFTKWHMLQSKVEKDSLTTASSSLQDMVAQGAVWCREPAKRQSLADVMPQAAAAVAAAATAAAAAAAGHRHSAGWPLHRVQGHHRRSGSAGSNSAVRIAAGGAAAKGASHLNRASSSSSCRALGGLGPAASNAASAAAAQGGAAASRRAVGGLSGLLERVVDVLGAAGAAAVGCASAVWQGLGLNGGQQLAVLAFLVVLGVQLMLLWQVVSLQGQVVKLLGQSCTNR